MKQASFSVSKNLGTHISSLKHFLKRLRGSFALMTLQERRLFYFSISIFVGLSLHWANEAYMNNTEPVPGDGGTYREAVFGEIKYINPILASSDAEDSVSKLLFSGLVKFENEKIVPDLAESWNISPDGLLYSFQLRENLTFSDGEPLDAEDVVYTIEKIKDPLFKSPLYDPWKDVEVTANSEKEIVFKLKNSYGPFIYNCDIGILPSHLLDQEFNKKFTGSGPFKYKKAKTVDNKIVELQLERNENYYAEKAHIDKVVLSYFSDQGSTEKAYGDRKFNGIFGVPVSSNSFNFKSSKRLALIANLRNAFLKDKVNREKLLGEGSFDEPQKFTLVTLDAPLQRSKVEEIKEEFSGRNVDLEIVFKNAVDIQSYLKDKDFDLLLYGFNFNRDRDPYAFWHSSQTSNFAGLANKEMDVLIEDARMLQDTVERNKKYDAFYSFVDTEYIAKFYSPVEYLFGIKGDLKGATVAEDIEAGSRYQKINQWYFKEKRIKK